MIQRGSDLRTYEQQLVPYLSSIQLLGQLPITESDFVQLSGLIRNSFKGNIGRDTRSLIRWTPTCFATFLVWAGITGYQAGNYWGAVHEHLGVTDSSWQTQWGQFFLSFLEKHQLPQFSIEGSPTYVTPILLHGLIPNACLSEYFDSVVYPLVVRQRVYHPLEVRNELLGYRQAIISDEQYDIELATLHKKKQSLDREIRRNYLLSQAYDDVQQLWQLEARAEGFSTQQPAAADSESIIENASLAGESESSVHAMQVVQHYERDYQHLQKQLEVATAAQTLLTQESTIRTLLQRRPTSQPFDEQIDQLSTEIQELQATLTSLPWQQQWNDRLAEWPKERLTAATDQFRLLSMQVADCQKVLDSEPPTDPHMASSNPFWSTIKMIFLSVVILTLLLSTVVLIFGAPQKEVNLPWSLESYTSTVVIATLLLIAAFLIERRRLQLSEKTIKLRQAKQAKEQYEIVVHQYAEQLSALEQTWPFQDILPVPWCGESDKRIATYDKLTQLSVEHSTLIQKQRAALVDEQIWLTSLYEFAHKFGLPTNVDITEMVKNLATALDQATEISSNIEQLQQQSGEIRLSIQRLQPLVQGAPQDVLTLAESAPTQWRLLDFTENAESHSGQTPVKNAEIDTVNNVSAEAQPDPNNKAHLTLRKQLSLRYPQLPKIEQWLRHSNKDGMALRQEAETQFQSLKSIQREIDALEVQKENSTFSWSTLDEPVRRFLRYGDTTAEQLLIDTTRLLYLSLQQNRVTLPPDHQLPPRVIDAFTKWWSQRTHVADTLFMTPVPVSQGTYFRTPMITCNENNTELVLLFPAQQWQATIEAMTPQLTIADESNPGHCHTYSLRAYQRQPEIVGTDEQIFALPFLADHYTVVLAVDSQIIQKWQVILRETDAPYLAFGERTKRLLDPSALPKGRIHLMTSTAATPDPVECILEQVALQGILKEHIFWTVDLSISDSVVLHEQGKTYNLTTSSEIRRVAPKLSGPSPIAMVDAAGFSLYTGSLPHLQIPITDPDELSQWQLFVELSPTPYQPTMAIPDAQFVALDQWAGQIQYESNRGWIELPLRDLPLLKRPKAGFVRIHLRKSSHNYEIWFAFLPLFTFKFQSAVYLPHSVTLPTPPLEMTLHAPPRGTFQVDSPGTVRIERQGTYQVSAPFSATAISGSLHILQVTGNTIDLPIRFTIPKVTWAILTVAKLTEDELSDHYWYDSAEEIWYDEWETSSALFLWLRVPPCIEDTLEIVMEGQKQGQRAPVINGMARFDLRALRDTLSPAQAVSQLLLRHNTSTPAFSPRPLLAVRTLWEIDEVECIQLHRGRTICLQLHWHEQGKASDRLVRIWHIDDSSKPVWEEPLVAQSNEAMQFYSELMLPATQLSPGNYLLQFLAVDAWVESTPSYPQIDDRNVARIAIVGAGNLRQGEIFTIKAVIDENCEHLLKGQYRIQIDGKIVNQLLPSHYRNQQVLVTHGNNGWYMGRALLPEITTATPVTLTLRNELLASSPFKIEYDEAAGLITTLEDRYGEGPMFCKNCGQLYWREEAIEAEEANGHQLLGPIERFTIQWDS